MTKSWISLQIWLVVGFFTLLVFNFALSGEQHSSYLAKSFLQGQLHFSEMPGSWADAVKIGEKYYWPLGLFPTAALVPFVALANFGGWFFKQGYLSFFLTLGIFFCITQIARKKGFNREDSAWWGAAFCGATAFLGVALIPWSWYYAQVWTTFLIFLAYLVFLTKKNYGIVGALFGLILLTRPIAALGVIYFLWKIWLAQKDRLKNGLALLSPLLLALVVWGIYNYARFGNPLDQGYAAAAVPDFIARACSYGLFSIQHIPANVYYFLVRAPEPIFRDGFSHTLQVPFMRADPWGLSVLFTSPYLLWLWLKRPWGKSVKMMLAVSLVVALPIFSYCGIGFRQFGYRYALDFLPWLHLALLAAWGERGGKLSRGFKMVVLLASVTNFYFFLTIFGV